MALKIAVVIYLFFVCCVAEKQSSSDHYEGRIFEKLVRLEYRLEKLEDKGKEGQEKVCYECPENWIRLRESCYLFEEKKYPFLEARYHCQRRGGDLVHVNDFTENEFLRQHHRTLKSTNFWIGLEDTVKEGIFKWIDDNTRPTFTGWDKGQPNNHARGQDCTHFQSSINYNWNDERCDSHFGSICEMKANL